MNGTQTNASFSDKKMDGRADLTPDGSLIIHSYEDEDGGIYECETKYHRAWYDIATLGMSIFKLLVCDSCLM